MILEDAEDFILLLRSGLLSPEFGYVGCIEDDYILEGQMVAVILQREGEIKKMQMLKDLVGSIQYDSSWGIWAKLIDGKFAAQSPARYGQRIFENGGLLDEFVFFADGVSIGDSYISWCGDFDFTDWEEEKVQIEQLFCADGTDFGGSRRELKEWVRLNEDNDAVSAILESARSKWDNQNQEMSVEWVEQLIEEINETFPAKSA